MKKFIKFLWVTFLILGSISVNAQVNIGSPDAPHEGAVLDLSKANSLGLLLPKVNLTDLKQFQLSGTPIDGMVVYNTNSNNEGEFIWIGSQWRALSVDGTMIINNVAVNQEGKPLPYDGSLEVKIKAANPAPSYSVVESPDCGEAGNYVFALIAGTDYAQVSPSPSDPKKFTVVFTPNEMGRERKAIILITDPCGKTSTFVFTQEAADCGDTQIPTPVIDTDFKDNDLKDTTLYVNGAVYAYVRSLKDTDIDDKVEDHVYYWLLNNNLVAEGAHVTLTAAGTYSVYADKIDCGTAGILTVTAGTGQAPAAKRIVVDNEGIICGETGQVKLSALNVSGSTVYWFKNGVKQPQSSDSYTAVGMSTGTWFAVVYDNNGASRESNRIEVSYQAGSSIPSPKALVNDVSLGSGTPITLCANGTLKLEIDNMSDYTSGTPVFTWYANDRVLGESDGQAIYVVPNDVETIILSVKATLPGFCPASATSAELTVDRVNTPAATNINGGATNAYICGNNPAILITAVQNAAAYEWFLGDEPTPIADATTGTLPASAEGRYSVRYLNASGCWSQISSKINVTRSSVVNLAWGVKPNEKELLNSVKTYSVISAPNASEYQWSLDDETLATITPIGDGAAAIVTYKEKAGDLIISVTASNSCGNVTLKSDTISVEAGCIPVSNVIVTSSAPTVKTGESVTYTVTATGSNLQYQWHLNGFEVSGETKATYQFTPTTAQSGSVHKITVNVYNTCSMPGVSSEKDIKVDYDLSILTPGPGLSSGNDYAIFMNGKTCLDVHQTGGDAVGTGNSPDPAALWVSNNWRLPLDVRPNDFSNGYDFTYTFAASLLGYGGAATVTYMYDDGVSNVVSGVSGDGTDRVTLRFNPSIVSVATNRTKTNPIKVTLYAIYKIGATAYKDSVNISIQDGACGCPAKIGDNTWKMDLCHVAGADYTKNPFIMDPSIVGYFYRWGRKAPVASYNNADLGNHVSYSTDLEWNMEKENPCPQGWRVASYSELNSIDNKALNPQTNINTQNEYFYQGQRRGYVPIPGGGYRETGTDGGAAGAFGWLNTAVVREGGYTFSSTATGSTMAYDIFFRRDTYTPTVEDVSKQYSLRVRCVSEGSTYTGR
jgi:hypothetical protein